jgi:SAM-dependent methyltransferase
VEPIRKKAIDESDHSSCLPTRPSMPRDAAEDWQAFAPDRIPSKGTLLPPLFYQTLERLLRAHRVASDDDARLQILELGCGRGDLCQWLHSQGYYEVVGTDVNQAAIELAKVKCPDGTFLVVDVTQHPASLMMIPPVVRRRQDDGFDVCVLQLLLSIVGGPSERRSTLQNAFSLLRPGGGTLYLSCSGVSAKINSNYERLYDQDKGATGEDYSYFSRDDNTGRILYTTHHFSIEELEELLESVGFSAIHIEQHKEASSRRPNEAAYFLYATAMRP